MAVAAHIRFARFYETTVGDDQCWEWQGGFFKHHPYGKFNAGTKLRNRTVYTHRYAWELAFGEIPPGLNVCHSCDNPKCVRPGHLFLGTQLQNVQDMISKDRASWQRDPTAVRRQLLAARYAPRKTQKDHENA